MAKISKRLLGYHNQAVKLLQKKELNFNDREFVFENFHEGAGRMNNLVSAHFTPPSIAHSMAHNIRFNNFVDLCAGIGTLAYKLVRQHEMSATHNTPPIFGICVENCTEFYEVGKKLLPQLHWINGNIFDREVIQEIKELMKGKRFSIISNPPYGSQVKTDTKQLLKYQGSNFEYKAIELGAILGAFDGAFLLPQQSCNFRMSGSSNKSVYDKEYITSEYEKFVKQTGLEMEANTGFSTDILEGEKTWKDVSIITEIAVIEYSEFDYTPKLNAIFETAKPFEQFTLFEMAS